MNLYNEYGGWNKDALEDAGVLEPLREVAAIQYELLNCVRTSDVNGLIEKLHGIKQDLQDAIDFLED